MHLFKSKIFKAGPEKKCEVFRAPAFRKVTVFFLFCFFCHCKIPLIASTTSDQIPHRTVFAIKALSSNEIWIGTENGIGKWNGKNWVIYREEDGLPSPVITSLAVDPVDKTLWCGTFGGIAKFESGRFVPYTTQNSKLVNEVVYGISITRPYLWVATTNGISRFNLETNQWQTFNSQNAPMNEVWCYGVTTNTNNDTWFAIWGGGIMRVSPGGEFTSYSDPDEIFDADLVRNDGLLHEIQVSVSAKENVVYAGSYFGLSRFDGKNWNTWTVKDPDSGIPSDFINTVKISPDGSLVAIGTDKGLCLFNYSTGAWVTFRKNPNGAGGERKIFERKTWLTEITPDGPAGDFVWSIDFLDDQIWVGTSTGLYSAKIEK